MDRMTSPTSLRRWAVASLLANMLIVLSGALVRLTRSGLGCSSWPECEPGSYVPHPELGIHAYIEFGNRLVTFVLIAISIGMALTAWRFRRDGRPDRVLRVLSVVIGAGILIQAVIGGVSVWSQLNPWIVGLHMVASVVLIVLCTVQLHRALDLRPAPVTVGQFRLTQVIFGASMLMIYLGTVVTGAGPHSGDGGAQRNGFILTEVARLHSLAMWLTLLLTILLVARTADQPRLRRAGLAVLGVAALQGLIGYLQYFTHLPMGLVLAHLAGTTLFVVAVSHLLLTAGRPSQRSSGSTAAAMKTTAR